MRLAFLMHPDDELDELVLCQDSIGAAVVVLEELNKLFQEPLVLHQLEIEDALYEVNVE